MMSKLCRLLVIMIMALTPLVAVHSPGNAVQGDVEWNIPLHAGYYASGAGVLTHGDGSVTVTGGACGWGAAENNRVATFSPSGYIGTQESGTTYPSLCNEKGEVGVDGTVFYTRTVNGHYGLAVMKNGVLINTVEFNLQCPALSGGGWGRPSGVILGTDGNVYVTIPGPNYGTGQNSSATTRLVKINGITGTKEFTVALSARASSSQNPVKMSAYADGLIILEEDVDSSGQDVLTYMSYSGVKNDTLSCAIHSAIDSCGFTIVNPETVNFMQANEDGTVFIDTSRYVGGACPYARRTLRYSTSGQTTVLSRPSDCASMHMSLLGPNETRVYSALNGSGISVLDASGNVLYTGDRNVKTGHTVTQSSSALLMDDTGHVVVVRVARQGASLDKHLYVDRLNTDGTWTELFSTMQYADANVTDDFKYRWGYDIPSVSFADGSMYVAYCETGCSSSGGMRLAKVDSPGMDIEYPRGEIFDRYYLTHGEPLDYVALGDSFSSGEGVPPFINGTATAGVNECHRSTGAYPALLDQDPTLDLNLRSFRACSGATTQTLVNGQSWPAGGTPTTSNQLSSLDGNTDVATITIGGNNVDFGGYAAECTVLGAGCREGSSAYQDITYAIDNALTPVLRNTYSSILDAAGNAELYVIGYPYMTVTGLHEYVTCGSDIDGLEAEAAHKVVTRLNAKIKEEVDYIDIYYPGRIHYVTPNYSGSPFEGHTLCDTVPYFTGVMSPVAYSFHPTSDGQVAYAQIIEDVMTN